MILDDFRESWSFVSSTEKYMISSSFHQRCFTPRFTVVSPRRQKDGFMGSAAHLIFHKSPAGGIVAFEVLPIKRYLHEHVLNTHPEIY